MLSFGQTDFDHARNINLTDADVNGTGVSADIVRTATSSTTADTTQFAVGGSYHGLSTGNFVVTPTAEISYYKSEIDAFVETGALGVDLEFQAQEVESIQARIGANASLTYSTDFGIVAPFLPRNLRLRTGR